MSGSGDLPSGLQWEIEPASFRVEGTTVTAESHGQSDNFIDPAGAVTALNGARALGLAPMSDWQFKARLTVDFSESYDAGVLLLWSDDRHFAKLCLEQSPAGRPMVVSVVTRGVSDDANAWEVEGASVWLRISGLSNDAYPFYSSDDGRIWELVRNFHLAGSRQMSYGIAVQSPIGEDER